MLADKVGASQAIWAPVLMMSMPLLIHMFDFARGEIKKRLQQEQDRLQWQQKTTGSDFERKDEEDDSIELAGIRSSQWNPIIPVLQRQYSK